MTKLTSTLWPLVPAGGKTPQPKRKQIAHILELQTRLVKKERDAFYDIPLGNYSHSS